MNAVLFAVDNKLGRVVYEIWRRQGDDRLRIPHATTKPRHYAEVGAVLTNKR